MYSATVFWLEVPRGIHEAEDPRIPTLFPKANHRRIAPCYSSVLHHNATKLLQLLIFFLSLPRLI
jgi:hypothetical protein